VSKLRRRRARWKEGKKMTPASRYNNHGRNFELCHLLPDVDAQAAACRNAWTRRWRAVVGGGKQAPAWQQLAMLL
jgi:hypothetical protein